ncbi:MAG TPA: lysophospholipase [Blastocatellia bacterium]|nr:lysophospholipase [Blastocatellia bacterium]
MTYVEEMLPAADGTRLYVRRREATQVRAEAVLVHGLGEHCGRYGPLTDHLIDRGYRVTAYDHRGHGKSEGLKGHVNRFTDYEDDLDRIVAHVRASAGERPLFLIGHSMGGLISLRYLARKAQGVAAAVVSAPAIQTVVKAPKPMVMVARIGSRLFPRMRVDNGLDPAVLSRDQEVGRRYGADPLVNRLVSFRWFTEMTRAMREVREMGPAITLPLLMMHGTGDKIVNFDASRRLFDRVRSHDKEFIDYPGYYHELFNEPEKAEIYRKVTDWIDARMR